MSKALFLYLIAFIAGFAFGIFKRVENQKKTKGIIIDLKQNYHNKTGRTTLTAIVSFKANNNEYQIESAFQSSVFHKGKNVVVYYNEKKPCEGFVRAPLIAYLFVYLLFLLGTILLIFR